jgi:hypothetical protein
MPPCKKKLIQSGKINKLRERSVSTGNTGLKPLDNKKTRGYFKKIELIISTKYFLHMDYHSILRFIHIVSFAAWFGSVLSSLFLLKTLEPILSGKKGNNVMEYAALLQKYIKLETKVADVSFIGVILSGLLLAGFYHGWTVWVFVKSGLIVLQVILTLGYIIRAIQPLSYPCSPSEYSRWYRLFAISLSMFALVLLTSFFLL